MEISSIKIYPFDTGTPQSSLRGYADVVLDDLIVIKGFRILVSKSGGLFISLPSKKGKDGKFYELIEFKSEAFQNQLRECILHAFKNFS